MSAPPATTGSTNRRTSASCSRTVEIASLHALHEPWTRLRDHLDRAGEAVEQRGKTGALQGADRRQDADRPVARGFGRRFHRGLHADDRHCQPCAQDRHGRSGGRVAGDHDQPGAPAREGVGKHAGSFYDGVGGQLAIRHERRVRDVAQCRARQVFAYFPENAQAPNARVEYADVDGVIHAGLDAQRLSVKCRTFQGGAR